MILLMASDDLDDPDDPDDRNRNRKRFIKKKETKLKNVSLGR